MGLVEEPAWPDGEPAQAAAEVSATARPSFPEDLAPACSRKPVAEARAYRAGSEPHPLAFFDGSGKLHAAWQQRLGEACPRSAIANFRNNLPPASRCPVHAVPFLKNSDAWFCKLGSGFGLFL